MTSEPSRVLRRVVGGVFVGGAVAFAGAATLLSSSFDWPDILREPAGVVLPAFAAGGTALVWTWFATAWTYAVLAVPILLLPAAPVLLSLIGFLRWVFVVPPLAEAYVGGGTVTREAVAAAWTAQHQFGGALLGEHLGQLLVVVWSVVVSVVALRTGVLPRWLGGAGLVASGVYLLNQGDVLATALPGFPVWAPAGFLGSVLWGVWVAALGVCLLRTGNRTTPAAVDAGPPPALAARS
jgi:hypothetical protein